MAYIGQSIKNGTFSVLDTSGNTYNGSNTTFSLGTQVGSAAQLLVSHDGVIQKPGTDYTLATGGTQITFTTAPASGASIFIVEISGAVGGTITPIDDSVTADKIVDDAVESEHLNNNIISGQTALAATPADTDEFLISDAGTIKRIDYSYIKASNTPSFSAYAPSGSSQSISTGSETKVNFSTELFDTDSKYDNSAMRFTPGVAGKYLITAGLSFGTTGDGNYVIIFIYKNGSPLWKNINRSPGSADNGVAIAGLVELDDDDYVEIFCKQNTGSNQTITGGNSDRTTFFGGFKLA